MNTLIESLKRLYMTNKIDIDKLNVLLKENKITQTHYDYIVAENDEQTTTSM